MRWSLLLLAACSPAPSVVETPEDASAPDVVAPLDDAGAEAQACVVTESCGLMDQESCDGGIVYGCTFGSCPSTAGACRVLAWDEGLQSGRSCCAEAACVRSKVPTDEVCGRPSTDAGTMRVGWVCPKTMKPEGKCLGLHGPASQEFCCEVRAD
jgi:hypothetical protein